MAFFKKLKSRLFKSSSKIEQGLDAIVEDGGEEEVVETLASAPDPVIPEPEPEPQPVPEVPAPTPEPVTVPEPAPMPEPGRPGTRDS